MELFSIYSSWNQNKKKYVFYEMWIWNNIKNKFEIINNSIRVLTNYNGNIASLPYLGSKFIKKMFVNKELNMKKIFYKKQRFLLRNAYKDI